jgi:UDPglucose 6-dehydrogenase
LDQDAAYKDADLILIATPTNYDSEKNSFDTSAVEAALTAALKVNKKAVIVIKSTIPVGYTESIRSQIPLREDHVRAGILTRIESLIR